MIDQLFSVAPPVNLSIAGFVSAKLSSTSSIQTACMKRVEVENVQGLEDTAKKMARDHITARRYRVPNAVCFKLNILIQSFLSYFVCLVSHILSQDNAACAILSLIMFLLPSISFSRMNGIDRVAIIITLYTWCTLAEVVTEFSCVTLQLADSSGDRSRVIPKRP